MSLTHKRIVVLGASGLVGSELTVQLAEKGARVIAISRNPSRLKQRLTPAVTGQVGFVSADITNIASIAPWLYCDGQPVTAVVNCVAILNESRKRSFQAYHVDAPTQVASAVRTAKISRFIHVSSLRVSQTLRSKYDRSKASGEDAVRATFPDTTMLAPSLIFGAHDDFTNRFARLARLSPVLPMPLKGVARFAPVHVGDVAASIVACLERDLTEVAGQHLALVGPQELTLKDILQEICREAHTKAQLLPLPTSLSWLTAIGFAMLPIQAPISIDQLRSLQTDRVLESGDRDGLAFLSLPRQQFSGNLPWLRPT